MSRFFLDTSILLDIACRDREKSEVAYKFTLEAFLNGSNRLYASAGSFKDVYYVYCRHYGAETEARKMVEMLRETAETVNLTDEMLGIALYGDEPDFEGGIVGAAAELTGCDYIVSHDEKAFAGSPIPRVTAQEALDIVLAQSLKTGLSVHEKER